MKEPVDNNVEEWFKFYLHKMKLKPEEMGKIQYQETKRAFYGGFAAMLNITSSKLSKLETQVQVQEAFQSMLHQVQRFWNQETENR